LKRFRWLAATAVAMVAGTGMLSGALGAAPQAGAAVLGPPHFYLALGGSDSVGFQPTAALPRGQRTDDGYADDLVRLEQARWSGLRLVQLGCPGETTMTMLYGGDRCFPSLSQLALAVSFLHQHPSTVLLTVDVGFNDIIHCIVQRVIDPVCVDVALGNIRAQLPRILTALRNAAPPGLRIVGVDHYDPYLAAYLGGPAGRSFAAQTVDVMTRVNAALRAVYTAAGIPMADAATVFDMVDAAPTTSSGGVSEPMNVARLCALTWVCVTGPLGHNRHPNDEGYRLIGEAISDLIARA
jgi:lysophospholipase L1-like esterase